MRRSLINSTIVFTSMFFLLTARSATSKELEIACRNQLMIIHEALMYYYDATEGELPNQLGELVGSYLTPDVLHCPAARAKGETDSGQAGLIDLSATDGRIRGYKWEFAGDRSYTKEDTKGRIYHWVDYKKQQLATPAGEWMPLVRCEHHTTKEEPDKRVNLALNGKIYTSKLYWESQFPHLVPYPYLRPDLVEFYTKPLKTFMRKRSENATPFMIDLRPYANAMPEHPWIWGNWNEEMDEFPRSFSDGIFISGGISFEISGLIQLNGSTGNNWETSFGVKCYPDASDRIKIPPHFKKIHILGGVIFESNMESKVACLELISSKGVTLARIPWEYGSDVVDIFEAALPGNLVTSNYEIAWKENIVRKQREKTACILQMAFDNPVPNQELAFLRFTSGDHVSCPFIVGLTFEL